MATRKFDPATDKISSGTHARVSGPPMSGVSSSTSGVRDALAALRNFDALFRSVAIDEDTLLGLMSEIGVACSTLREAFHETPTAYQSLASFAKTRIDELDALLSKGVPSRTDERVALGQHLVSRDSTDLTAAAELLDLAVRSECPASIELSLSQLAREALQMVIAIHAEAMAEVFVEETTDNDAVVLCDPQIASRLIAIAVAMVYQPESAVTVRVRITGEHAILTVEGRLGKQRNEASLPIGVRVLRLIEPTEDVAIRAARAAGITLSRRGNNSANVVEITIPLE